MVLTAGVGFGSGAGFLATWQAWRADPQRCGELQVIVIDPAPLSRAALAGVVHAAPLRDLAEVLLAAWPPLTPDLHSLRFEAGRVTLMLAIGPVDRWLHELVAEVDEFELGRDAPHGRARFKAPARLAAPGATLRAAPASPDERKAMREAGFEPAPPSPDAGVAGTTSHAVFAPAFVPRRRGSVRSASASAERRALIVGAGLAGCATAWALGERGWRSSVIDRHGSPAGAASGNPAGLFHGIVTPHDGAHARLHRAAALEARAAVGVAVERHGVAGSTLGFLRQEMKLDLASMQAMLARLRLPADYLRAIGPAASQALCGLPQRHPAWFYPGGGWVDPGGLARSLLERAGAAATFRGGTQVDRLRRCADAWELLDADGAVIDAAPTVVLANAADAFRLAGLDGVPFRTVRGQLSWFEPGQLPAGLAPLPRIALAGSGYLLPAVGGRAVFGATAQPDDADPSVRGSDHERNLRQLEGLLGRPLGAGAAARLHGRTAWRCTARDRLPVIGAVPVDEDVEGSGAAWRAARRPGLYLYSALGSRGITWSALGARIVAALVSGAPAPVEAGLLDAVDPARFARRALRRSRGAAPAPGG